MGKMNAAGIKTLKQEVQQHNEELDRLIKEPFDINNQEHLATIEKYTTEFALTVNKRYLYQALSDGFNKWVWGISLGAQFVLPIPGFLSSLDNYYLGLTAIGYFLEQAGTTDFLKELEDVKKLYNWALKGGKEHANPSISNTKNLENPIIQELFKLLAPICEPDFLRVWPAMTASNESSGIFGIVANVTSNIWGLFAPKPTASETLKRLQLKVEQNDLAMNSVDAGIHALRYFTTNPQFRAKIKEMLPMQQIESAANIVPSAARHLKPH